MIPIVFLTHADPVGTGHVASLARPGGNITGLALLQTEIYRKELEFLISAVPTAKRIAVLWNPDAPSHTPGLKALEESARLLQVQLQAVVARTGPTWKAPSRPWLVRTRRPFWCLPSEPTRPKDSA